MAAAPKSICVLRLSAIGDCCHATAVVQTMQRHLPDTKFTWVIGKVEHQLLQGLPGVEFIVFDKSQGLSAFWQLRRQMKERHFDILLHMQRAIRASIASLFIPATRKVGWDRERARELQWLFTNERVEAQQEPHVIDGFFAFAAHIGISQRELQWNIPLTPDVDQWRQKSLPQEGKILVINPSASDPRRNWTIEGYAQVADHVRKTYGWHIVLTGGPSPQEIDFATKIAQRCEMKTTNLAGKTSLKQLFATMQRADLVLTPDSGPAHIATAAGAPVVGIYMHSNPRRTGPVLWRDKVINLYDDEIIRQYGKPYPELRWGIRAKTKDGLQKLPAQQVIEHVSKIIDELK